MSVVDNELVRLVCEQVTVRRGGVELVRPTTFTAVAGQLVLVTGPNGSGKSSLLDALTGIQPLSKGSVRLRTPLGMATTPHRCFAVGASRLFQQTRLCRSLSTIENLRVAATSGARYRRDAPSVIRLDEAVGMMEMVGVTIGGARAVRLSTGQERLLSVLCVALARPWLVLLDEPFGAMDPISTRFAHTIMARFLDEKAVVLLIEHSREAGRRSPDRIVSMTE